MKGILTLLKHPLQMVSCSFARARPSVWLLPIIIFNLAPEQRFLENLLYLSVMPSLEKPEDLESLLASVVEAADSGETRHESPSGERIEE